MASSISLRILRMSSGSLKNFQNRTCNCFAWRAAIRVRVCCNVLLMVVVRKPNLDPESTKNSRKRTPLVSLDGS